jgi:3-phenylpropionate/trans-cinnamate dioxygenase ferredoxin reductase subunit
MLGVPSEWDDICIRGETGSFKFSAFYLKDSKVVAAATFNKGVDLRAARQFIAAGKAVDVAILQDAAVALKKSAQNL